MANREDPRGRKGTFTELSETELNYKPENAPPDATATQKINKIVGDSVSDDKKKIKIREINKKIKGTIGVDLHESVDTIYNYDNVENNVETVANQSQTAVIKDKTYHLDNDSNKYERKGDITYTATTKGIQKVDNKDLNYDIPITDVSVSINNQDLLEIFDQGINNIVLRLKSRFGENNNEVNEVVKSIKDIFGNIDTIIQDEKILKNDVVVDDSDYNQVKDGDGKLTSGQAVSKKSERGEYTSTIQNKHSEEATMKTQFDQIKSNYKKFEGDLDKQDTNYTAAMEGIELSLDNDNTIEILNTRLKNCQALELFHLKLFENFMKTGAFTLSLYEKYKYVTTVMLYLLKNLVNKPKLEKITDCSISGYGDYVDDGDGYGGIHGNDKTPRNCPKIRLPKTVIKNIGRLVEEQNRIQGTINTIDTALKQTKLDDVYGYASAAIDENLKAETTPADKSVPHDAEIATDAATLINVPPHNPPTKIAKPTETKVKTEPPINPTIEAPAPLAPLETSSEA